VGLESFAATHRLRVRTDECGDKIIPGKRGHLYFDAGRLCLMVTDGPPRIRSKWQALGGKLWMGAISPDAKDRRVQDVWIKNIPLENAKEAIRMCGIKRVRELSPAQEAVLQKARERSPIGKPAQ